MVDIHAQVTELAALAETGTQISIGVIIAAIVLIGGGTALFLIRRRRG
ncbi:LPXTG cell wall anchor domain-containing protein [Microbacterium sp. G2-8]|nr:LPXTG cell wall anchor domain-containing protein [Microbacterium sp. G2-8]